jgi:4-hydroxy-tetrahydrodipicolinate reductase
VYAGAIGRDGVLPAPLPDVILDVSLPAGTAALARTLLALPPPAAPGGGPSSSSPPALVVGTTGSDLPLAELEAYARRAPVVLSANFSLGVPLVLSMLEAGIRGVGGLPEGWAAEVSEIHHTAKRDAPSGTAKRLVGGLYAAGARAADPAAPIPTHALRLGDTVGVHTVYLAGPGERVEVTHTATRREVFAIGALRTAAWAAKAAPGLYHK